MDTTTREAQRLLYVGDEHDDFFLGLARGARMLGFDHCGYLVGVPDRNGDTWRFAAINDFSRRWRERYRKHAYFDIDPMLEHAKQGELPLVWTPALYEQDALRSLRQGARAFGFAHGWALPLRVANGGFGMLMLARGKQPISDGELREKHPMMRWLAQAAHMALFRHLFVKQCAACPVPLTEREIELLRLTADGKTAVEIARMLNLTERTANFHIANAMTKLGAATRTHAVALALRLGVLV